MYQLDLNLRVTFHHSEIISQIRVALLIALISLLVSSRQVAYLSLRGLHCTGSRAGCASQASCCLHQLEHGQLLSESWSQWQKTQDLPSKVGDVPLCKLWQSLSPRYQVWSG